MGLFGKDIGNKLIRYQYCINKQCVDDAVIDLQTFSEEKK
uniref:Uncharacterized protein n=1 Tax=Klebsiella pneumoniae TaxID=573 RepID=A0A6G6ANV0_KLEPN|nr:hypothetical protein [Klebsiella pneumoniae]UFD97103.1 hypothetical protein [Klebsiella pneumoniae]